MKVFVSSLAVALVVMGAASATAATDLERQMRFVQLYGGQDTSKITSGDFVAVADELRGHTFKQGPTGSACLTVAADGSWQAESPLFADAYGATELAGPTFSLETIFAGTPSQRRVLQFRPAAPDAPPLGAFVRRLTVEDRAQLRQACGACGDLALLVVYGSLADGQVVMLVANE